jgi:hypothetical protein
MEELQIAIAWQDSYGLGAIDGAQLFCNRNLTMDPVRLGRKDPGLQAGPRIGPGLLSAGIRCLRATQTKVGTLERIRLERLYGGPSCPYARSAVRARTRNDRRPRHSPNEGVKVKARR